MKVRFEESPAPGLEEAYLDLLRRNNKTALIFSRIERLDEVIAIVPYSHNTRRRYWVWLSGGEGSYCGTGLKSLDEIAKTLVDGDWEHQPGATLILEHKRD